MQEIDLLVTADHLIPVEPAGVVIEDGAMAVHEGRIVALMLRSEADKMFAPRERLDLPGHVVMPGLINAHSHAAMSLMRGLADDLPLMDWLQQHIWPVEGTHVSEAFCADGVQLAMLEMVRGGTTCFNDMYFFPDITAREVDRAGMAASVGLIVIVNVVGGGMRSITFVQAFQYWLKLTAIAVPALVLIGVFAQDPTPVGETAPPRITTATTVDVTTDVSVTVERTRSTPAPAGVRESGQPGEAYLSLGANLGDREATM